MTWKLANPVCRIAICRGEIAVLLGFCLVSVVHAQHETITSLPPTSWGVSQESSPTSAAERSYVELRDLCHLPFKDILTSSSEYNWVIASFKCEGYPQSPQIGIVDTQTGAVTDTMDKDNENNGLFYKGSVQVRYVLSNELPVELNTYRVQIDTFGIDSGASADRLNNLPFLTGGEALLQVFPSRNGNQKYAQIYLVPQNWERNISESIAFIKQDSILRSCIQRNDIFADTSEAMITRKERYSEHLIQLLKHQNPSIVAAAYTAIKKQNLNLLDADTIIEERIKSAHDFESAFYTTLLLSDKDLAIGSSTYRKMERFVADAKDFNTLYALALSVRAVAHKSVIAEELLKKARQRADVLNIDKVIKSSPSLPQAVVALNAILPPSLQH